MSLHEILSKIKPQTGPETISFNEDGEVEKGQFIKKFFLSLIIIMVASLSFGIGRLTSRSGGGEPVKIEYDPSLSSGKAEAIKPVISPNSSPNSSYVTASSKGTKYYYENCSGISRISEANKITFPSAMAAEASGYSLASGCKQ